jgi:DNA-binding NtrC family response regulator
MTAPLRILVVEDDAQLLGYLACLLAGWGFESDSALSATDALASCDRRCPDVVISDLMMPGMGGLELLHALRAIPDCHILFILITGHGTVPGAVRAIMEGVDEVMMKPIDEAALLAILRRFDVQRKKRGAV